jgi:hypothetical protein
MSARELESSRFKVQGSRLRQRNHEVRAIINTDIYVFMDIQ